MFTNPSQYDADMVLTWSITFGFYLGWTLTNLIQFAQRL